jgi:Tfp pilus assembly protein FimV
MKRISLFLAVLCLSGTVAIRAQDAATEERINKLNGLVQDLLEDKSRQQKQIAELSKQLEALREQVSKPAADAVTHDELRKLAESVKEVDRKRIEDSERVAKEFERLSKVASAPPSNNRKAPRGSTSAEDTSKSAPSPSDKGYEYEVQSGDTLLAIAQAYKEKGVKVTVDQILKANPGLKEKSLIVGKKIFIPAQP